MYGMMAGLWVFELGMRCWIFSQHPTLHPEFKDLGIFRTSQTIAFEKVLKDKTYFRLLRTPKIAGVHPESNRRVYFKLREKHFNKRETQTRVAVFKQLTRDCPPKNAP